MTTPEAPHQPAAAAPGVPGGGRVILFADDEPALRYLARALLERHGYTVLLAEDGRQAADLFRRERGRIGLVLLDLEMPGRGGLEALRDMAAEAAVAALLITGRAPPPLPPELRRHVRGVLAKPFGAEQFLRQVRAALGE